jgi:hypothetical protein
MTTLQIVLLVLVFVAVDFAVVGGVIYAATSELREFSSKYPPHEPRPNAIRKEFQSFKIGIVGLGGCIHVAVDEDFLHLSPAWVARRFGMKPMSIPWERIEPKGPFFGRFRVTIDGTMISGPKWCFELLER